MNYECLNFLVYRSQREEDGNVTGDGETGAANSSAKTVEKKMSARTEKSLISDEEFLRYVYIHMYIFDNFCLTLHPIMTWLFATK